MCAVTVADKGLISTSEASERFGYSADYVGQLCREGKIDCRRMSGQWHVDPDSLQEHKNREENEGAPTSRKDEKGGQAEPRPSFAGGTGNVRDDTFTYDGVEYISTQRAGSLTGYTQDYVGQLARGGEVAGRKIGRHWFVSRAALLAHKKHKDSLLQAVQARSSGLGVEGNATEKAKDEGMKVSIHRQKGEGDISRLNFNVRYITETDAKPLIAAVPDKKYDAGDDEPETVLLKKEENTEAEVQHEPPNSSHEHDAPSIPRSSGTGHHISHIGIHRKPMISAGSVEGMLIQKKAAQPSKSRQDERIKQEEVFVVPPMRHARKTRAAHVFALSLAGVVVLSGAMYALVLFGFVSWPSGFTVQIDRITNVSSAASNSVTQVLEGRFGDAMPGRKVEYQKNR